MRLFDLGLYSLNLTNNFIDYKGIDTLCSDLFKVSPKTIEQIVIQQDDPNTKFINDHHRVQDQDIPLSTSVRILILDHNFLNIQSMNQLAKVILT